MGIEGNVKDFPLIDVLNLLSFGNKTGVLVISGKKNDETINGEIYFQGGKIIDAICGNKRGEEAFYSIFLMSEGNFTFKTQNINIIPKIEKSFDNLLLEAIRKADELKVLYSKIPDLTTILETNPNVEASEIRLSSDEWQVLNLFKERKSIREALKISPFSEFETLKSIYLLLSFNLLTKAEEIEIDLSKIVPKRVISPVKDALSILGLSQPRTICEKVLFKVDGLKSLQDIANELKISKNEILSCFIKLLKETKIIANISLEKIKTIERLTKEEWMNLQNFLYPAILALIFQFFILIALRIRRGVSLAFFYLLIGGVLSIIQFVSFPGYLALLRGLSVQGIPLIPVYFISIVIISIFIIFEMFDIEISRNYTISLIFGRILVILLFFSIFFIEYLLSSLGTEKFELKNVFDYVYLITGKPTQILITLAFFVGAIFVAFLVYALLRAIKFPFVIASIISIFAGGLVNMMSVIFPLFFVVPQMFFGVFYHLAFVGVILSLFTFILWGWVKGKE